MKLAAIPVLLVALVTIPLLSAPSLALVEPESEAWQKYVGDLRSQFSFPGGELFVDAAQEVGNFAGSFAAAPLADLMEELEKRRGLNFKYFTPWHVKDKAGLRRYIRRALEKEYTPAKLEGEEAVLKALGLVPLDFKLLEFTEDLLTDGVGGIYDPEEDQFFLVDLKGGQPMSESLKLTAQSVLMGDMNSVIIIHELDHALGGQHFRFKETLANLSKGATLDAQMAAHALIEGDATFVMIDHQSKQPPESAGANTVIAGADALTDILMSFPFPLPGMAKFSEAPLFFQRSLIFPYYTGAEFVSTLKIYDGWSMVDRAYTALPTTTESILHPDEYAYLVNPPLTPDFEGISDPFRGWKKVKDETGGEFLLRVVLEQYGVEDFRRAAAGWNGDRLRVFRNQTTGALGFYWVIRWDSAEEGDEFYNSLGSHLPFVVEHQGDFTALSLAFTPDDLQALRAAVR